ncbi:MAG: PQQ-binding-like beta-propeller repeat protein [Gemmataceae bacterium]
MLPRLPASSFASACLLLLGISTSSLAADWPQFLGPKRDGVSSETVSAWTGELKPLWKKPIGPAHSSPVVAKGIVYAFYELKGKNTDTLAAIDGKTGETIWEKSYERDEFEPPFGYGPRGTPVVDGADVFTLGGTGVLASWNAKTGEVNWKVDTLKQFQVENLPFGVSGSPLVYEGRVYVNVGGKGAGVVAFDRATGKTLWQTTNDGMSYSSPIVVGTGEAARIVFLTKQNLIAFHPKTGEVAWKVPYQDQLSESATAPIVVGQTLYGSSVTLGSIALDLSAPSPKTLWKKRELNCYFSTPVAVGDDLYMLNGVLNISPSITLRCVEGKTGKIRWEKSGIGKYHAAIIRTAGDKLLMLDDGGSLTLFEANKQEFKQLAKSKVCGPTWAHPALADGIVYLRDEKNLMAFRVN